MQRPGVRGFLFAALVLGVFASNFVDCTFRFRFAAEAARLIPGLVFSAGASWALAAFFLEGRRRFLAVSLPLLILLTADVAFRAALRFQMEPRDEARMFAGMNEGESLLSSAYHESHHYTLYNPLPDLKLPSGLVHNRLGFRDHREFETKGRVLRVVFLGGSTTYGAGVRDNRELFTHHLEEALNAEYRDRLDGNRVEVINAGMVGASSAESLLRLVFFVSEVSPDLLVIQHGISDVWPRVLGGPMRSDFGNYRKAWHAPPAEACRPIDSIASAAARWSVNHSPLLRWVGKHLGYPDPTLLRLSNVTNQWTGSGGLVENDDRFFVRNTRYMIQLARGAGAQVVLAGEMVPARPKQQRRRPTRERKNVYEVGVPQHNAALARLAAEENLPFFDFAAAMPGGREYMADDKHVNARGARVKSRLFQEFFREQGIVTRLLAARSEAENRP